MKMSKESYDKLVVMMKEKKDIALQHKEYLIKENNYKCLNTRLGFDLVNAFMLGFVSSMYDNEGLNDTHINTAITNAMKEVGIV